MSQHSAGILAYKFSNMKLEVMLAHPGGPFWEGKDTASWSIPKGLLEADEAPLDAAKREFKEETGISISGKLIELGTIKQPSKKLITIFATEIDIDVSKVSSNLFEMEWPPKSGIFQQFPENDKTEWFQIEIAKQKIFKGQVGFLDRLIKVLGFTEQKEAIYEQLSLF